MSEAVVRRQILTCGRCELRGHARLPVPFHGPSPCHTMVVGEAPGRDEDVALRPFVGRSGQLLRQYMVSAGLDPTAMFWANAACCYPGSLKTPTDEHLFACRPNLEAQIRLANPSWILVVGSTARRAYDWRKFAQPGSTGVFYTVNPAAALRNPAYKIQLRKQLENFVETLAAEELVKREFFVVPPDRIIEVMGRGFDKNGAPTGSCPGGRNGQSHRVKLKEAVVVERDNIQVDACPKHLGFAEAMGWKQVGQHSTVDEPERGDDVLL
jgi:DNA polymerase